jgi:hypothetical protein
MKMRSIEGRFKQEVLEGTSEKLSYMFLCSCSQIDLCSTGWHCI